MRKKRILPFLLSLLILCSSLQLPVDAKEMDASGKQDTTNMESEISVQGTDSFGNMVAEAIDNKVEQQEENEGCNIFEITMSGTEAEVDFETNKDASLVVGIYDEAGIKMAASGHAEVTTDEKTVKINIEDGQLPDYYYVKGFLVDPETYEPYCTAYETPNYTREMQEFFSKTTEDFAGHEILNLDDDTTNNFAVYADGTYVVKESESEVKLSEKDEDAGKYVFENADEAFLALKSGDILSYECADGSLVIIKIDSVSVNGKTVTLYDKDTEMEDVFDYVKIDSEASTEEATVDASTCGEGVTYNGLVDSDETAPQKIDIDVSESKSHSFDIKNNDITGNFKLQLKTGLKLYITSSYRYLELRMDYTKSVSISIKKKCKKEFPLITLGYSPVPGVYIEVKPVFVVEGSGKVSLNGTLKGTIGCAVESDTGIRNLTSMPSFETELKGEVTVFIGISLEPKVKVLSDEVAMVGASAQVGGEANATLAKDKGDSQKHMCKTCIEGTINAKGEVNFKVSFFNNDKLTYTQGTSLKAKIGDFYYSEDFNEFAFTTCPHISYRIIVTVKNKQGQVVKDVLVNNENKTDQNGQATLYLPNGTHTLTVTSQKGTELGNKEITVKDSAKKVEVEVDDNVIDGLRVKQVSCARGQSGVITEDGSLWMWGNNEFGQLGDGTTETKKNPVKIMEHVKSIDLDTYHSGAITEDGNLWMWGLNSRGQLGDGTTKDKLRPVKVMENVTTIDLGNMHSGAITEDGNLWMWGENEYGQLGDGTTETTYNPVKIMSNVKSVSLGYASTGVIAENGDLYTWGENEYGQLGNGTTETTYNPMKIMSNVKSVSLGLLNCGAITEDGNLWMWGSGELGDGTTETTYNPVKIMSNVKSISNGNNMNAAITEDGNLWMWGFNSVGQLGDGTTETKKSPVKIMHNVKSVSAGFHSGAITEDGNLWMWGGNSCGELGNGSTKNSVYPINITDQFNQTQQLNTDEPATNIALQSTPSTTSFKNLNPNGIYNFYIMKDKETQQPFDNGNLLYINQYQAQSDGTLSVNYETTGDTSNAEAFVVGGNIGDESQEMKFKDVSPNDWFYSSVMYVNKNGLMTGLNETEFGPVQSLARAQFAMILYRMNGSPAVDYTNKFKDVSAGIWYTDPIMWASNKGVVTGYSNGNFGPGDNINREQMAVMMYRYAKTQGYDVSASVALGNYKDGANVSGFAKQAMQWCVAEGIITGKYNGTQLDPQGNAIRAECATIIRRFVEKYE
nr:S-layer homology domain-containing protein [uncultured Dorea sp.]